MKNQKAFFTYKIRDLVKEQLERDQDSKDIFTIAPNVLNTEAWIRYKDKDGESFFFFNWDSPPCKAEQPL